LARKDDYENAFKLAARELGAGAPAVIGGLSGAEYDEANQRLVLEFIGRRVFIAWPDIAVGYLDSEEAVPITEQVLILHYLSRAKGAPLSGQAITYREVPSGEFYYPAFVKRAEAPMLSVFGNSPELLTRTAPEIGGRPVEDLGDAAAVFQALPQVPVTLVVWGGDDEFEPSGKILFDRSISHYLDVEDVAWLSGMIVYRLMRLAPKYTGGN